MFIISCRAGFGALHAKQDNAASGKSGSWPGGEPQKIRDAYDAQHGTKKK